jgi:DNA-binding NarL/FixJ family response regulator
MNSMSPLASVRATDRGASVLASGHGVGFALDDAMLVAALRRELFARTDLYETGEEAASVIVTDREGPASSRVLRVGSARGRNILDSLDPALILSAAAVVAAGYGLTHPEAASPRFPAHLSQRERQVAALLVDGASNKLIARALDISVHTAKFHVTAILDKLGARNRADAVSIILREGLVAI